MIGANRFQGAVMLKLLRHPEEWVHRRVESLSIDNPVVTGRRISVDFTLDRTLPSAWINGAGQEVHFVPMTLMKKTPMVKFSIADEAGVALPVLTSRRNGALALSAVVVLGEAFAKGAKHGAIKTAGAEMPADLQRDLGRVVLGKPLDADGLRRALLEPSRRWDLSERTRTWRRFLAEDREFMKALRRLSHNFILAVPVVGRAGVRRVIKFSYEEHSDKPRLSWPRPIRPAVRAVTRIASGPRRPVRTRDWWLALNRGLGIKPTAIEIKVPAMAATNSYHLEVEAPNGLQITLGKLQTRKGEVVDQDATSRQRIHLYTTRRRPGKALIALRPQPFSIVRTAWLVSIITVVTLGMTAVFTSALARNLSEAASILLLVPAGLAAYVAQTREPVATKEALFGLRILATAVAIWPFAGAVLLALATETHVAGPHAAHAGETIYWNWHLLRPLLIGISGLALANFVALSIYLVRVYRPPEQVAIEDAFKDAEPTS
jgi:hypothetical protein